ncbi:MAG: transposase [Proteobacteria bacterium]|nr:transposase [Pseudomonadota bacterium]
MADGKRKFDREFKVETVRLIVEGGRSDEQKKAGPFDPAIIIDYV